MSGAATEGHARLEARVIGRVQAVGFRWWAYRQAEQLGLVGWVRNAEDRRVVELAVEGSSTAVAEFERLLQAGPPGARIERVEARRTPPSGREARFEIVR